MTKTPNLRLYKNITEIIIKCYLLKGKFLYGSYLNQQSEHGKLSLTPNGRIVKMGIFNANY